MPAVVVVIVFTPEAVLGISSPGLCSPVSISHLIKHLFAAELPDGRGAADVLLDIVLAGELGHVVDDLVVEVRVVGGVREGRDGGRPVPEGGGRVPTSTGGRD